MLPPNYLWTIIIVNVLKDYMTKNNIDIDKIIWIQLIKLVNFVLKYYYVGENLNYTKNELVLKNWWRNVNVQDCNLWWWKSTCAEIESYILMYSKLRFIRNEIEVFYSGEAFCEYVKQGNFFDLLFLDIELPAINGIEVGKFVRTSLGDEKWILYTYHLK